MKRLVRAFLRTRWCPPWCMEAHIGERRGERIHNAWLRGVELSADPLSRQLWLDLILRPEDDEPYVQVQLDDHLVAELTVSQARAAGVHLIELGSLGGMESPDPPVPGA
ncbi:DUF6907 domain-containing protein [Microbispora amethystogenes]|uniref:Uncharacterized protein n=1 Tax=Microbispora amethystogenes TaxID=1427754 RepID=A0ABQ4F610_9ACTN|nr:hypothetical protein [Microbispora amethystogenes]GIH30251.1 hypothetical protein Mam01_04150 [Microbispora amethystogenes]